MKMKKNKCELCRTDKNIQKHHVKYKFWDKKDEIIMLCTKCHRKVHKEKRDSKYDIKLQCKKCGYIWGYDGKSEYYTSCPRCKNANVNVKKDAVK